MHRPPPHPDKSPRNKKDHNDSGQNPKTIPRDNPALRSAFVIEEGVGIKPLCVEGDVRDAEVEKQNQDKDRDGDEGVGVCGWEDDFEEGVEGVEAVLGDLLSYHD